MPPRKSGSSTKFERARQFQTRLHVDILHSQQTAADVNGDLADTELICDGGCIRVHAFLLQAASPVIRMAMASQGEDYPHIRKVLLPDFPVKIIERMLSLIYKGYADLPTDQEVENLKEVLKFFQVASVDLNVSADDTDCKVVEGNVKVQELNRIPQDIFKKEPHGSPLKSPPNEGKPKVAVVIKPIKKKIPPKIAKPSAATNSPVRRSGRQQKPVMKLNADTAGDGDDDSDFNVNSGAESSSYEPSDDESKPKRGGRRPGGSQQRVAVKLPSKPGSTASVTKTSTPTPGTPNRSEANKIVHNNVVGGKEKKDEDSGTDSEDDDWVKPNFKDREWFAKESTRCQCCKKTFEKPAGAALCITSHKTLRCYFCFRVYSTTDILFKHFRRRHKQAGRESTLICPFCDQAVPYKSVSCHVISVHLSQKDNNNKFSSPAKPAIMPPTPSKSKPNSSGAHSSNGKRRSRSRSTSVDRRSSSEKQPQKKIKHDQGSARGTGKKTTQLKITNLKDIKKAIIEKKKKGEKKLQVRDLDVTLEKKTVVGKTLVFRIQKVRPVIESNPAS